VRFHPDRLGCIDGDTLNPEAEVLFQIPKVPQDVVGEGRNYRVVQGRGVSVAAWWNRGIAIGQRPRHQHLNIPAHGCDREALALREGDVNADEGVHTPGSPSQLSFSGNRAGPCRSRSLVTSDRPSPQTPHLQSLTPAHHVAERIFEYTS
jgi:hypothetical protein